MGQGACLKGMSRTITMQGFMLSAITDADKNSAEVDITPASGKVNRP